MDINKIITKLLNDKASQEELEVLENWKSESEDNIKELQDLIAIKNASEDLNGYKEFDVDAALKKVDADITKDKAIPKEFRTTIQYKRILIIFILIISIIASGLLLFKRLEVEKGPVQYQAQNIAEMLNLKDGSVVNLDKNSSLVTSVDFESNRSVILEGRAFFNVNHLSENNPFRINVPNAEIKVVGTEFSVYTDSTRTEVSVLSGVVEVSSQNRKIKLGKGDFLLFEDNDFIKTNNNNPNYFAWNSGKLVFSDTNILEILKTLAWSYSVVLNIENINEHPDCNFTTKYENMDLNKILEELKLIANLNYEYNNGVIIVKSINCS